MQIPCRIRISPGAIGSRVAGPGGSPSGGRTTSKLAALNTPRYPSSGVGPSGDGSAPEGNSQIALPCISETYKLPFASYATPPGNKLAGLSIAQLADTRCTRAASVSPTANVPSGLTATDAAKPTSPGALNDPPGAIEPLKSPVPATTWTSPFGAFRWTNSAAPK